VPGRCRGAATLSQQEKKKSADVQRKRINFPGCSAEFSGRVTASNCSPAVASRRAKYANNFLVPALLSAQPRSRNFFMPPTQSFFPIYLDSSVPEGRASSRSHADPTGFFFAQQRFLLSTSLGPFVCGANNFVKTAWCLKKTVLFTFRFQLGGLDPNKN